MKVVLIGFSGVEAIRFTEDDSDLFILTDHKSTFLNIQLENNLCYDYQRQLEITLGNHTYFNYFIDWLLGLDIEVRKVAVMLRDEKVLDWDAVNLLRGIINEAYPDVLAHDIGLKKHKRHFPKTFAQISALLNALDKTSILEIQRD